MNSKNKLLHQKKRISIIDEINMYKRRQKYKNRQFKITDQQNDDDVLHDETQAENNKECIINFEKD